MGDEEVTDGKSVVDIASNIMMHCQLLVGDLDDLEEHPTIFKQKLKQLGKQFSKELDKTMNLAHSNMRGGGGDSEKNVLLIYDDYYALLRGINRLSINEKANLAEVFPELIEKIKSGEKVTMS